MMLWVRVERCCSGHYAGAASQQAGPPQPSWAKLLFRSPHKRAQDVCLARILDRWTLQYNGRARGNRFPWLCNTAATGSSSKWSIVVCCEKSVRKCHPCFCVCGTTLRAPP